MTIDQIIEQIKAAKVGEAFETFDRLSHELSDDDLLLAGPDLEEMALLIDHREKIPE